MYDEWRKHIISGEHLQFEDKTYCDICKNKHSLRDIMVPLKKCRDAGRNHRSYSSVAITIDENTHKKNQERFDFFTSYFFKYLFLQKVQ